MRHLLTPRRLAPLALLVLAPASTCRAAEATTNTTNTAPAMASGMAKGWPVLLRGGVTGAPVVADVDGDGHPEVVAPAMKRDGETRDPNPTSAPQMWAFHADGTLVAAWPVTLRTVETQEDARKAEPGLGGNWYSSPSVCDVNGDGADEVIIGLPHTKERHVVIVYGDGGVVPITGGGEPWSSVPVFDLDRDGVPDIVAHDTITNVRGGPVEGWPQERRPQMVYQPAIGDADGDGEPEVFVPTFQQDFHLPGMPEAKRLEGLDRHGNRLPGWPRKMPNIATYVSLGDVAGDSKKEVICIDWEGNLHVWKPNGEPAFPASAISKDDASIVRSGLHASYAPPCLADVDGDGQAEILLLNGYEGSVLILRGDGKPFMASRPAPDPDKLPETLPTIQVRDFKTGKMRALDPNDPADRKRLERLVLTMQRVQAGRAGGGEAIPLAGSATSRFAGVTAVDLGGDGVLDVFAGTSWLQVKKDGAVTSTSMLSEEDRGEARNNASCSVFDADGDGRAEVAFGLTDGRLFLFHTGQTLKAQDAQWPTVGGDFAHTGVWQKR